MANPEHLSILMEGVEIWNEWREEHPDIEPDLSNLDLKNTNLRFANLINTNLEYTNLKHTYFLGANLYNTNLKGAILDNSFLRNVNLEYADLQKASLISADLEGVYLSNANLKYANLENAILRGATLRSAILSSTILEHAKLYNANLEYSNLEFAKMYNAQLEGANLESANLNNTDLYNTNLVYTNLRNALLENTDLRKARLSYAIFENTSFTGSEFGNTTLGKTDLSHCNGLESVMISSSCIIDFETLQRSKGLPRAFLKKIGLSDIIIDYIPSFRESPINLYPVFLSHTWENKAFARKLYEALINKNVQVWFDEKKMKPGDIIRSRIDKGINTYDKMILVCSREALNSWWIGEELEGIYEKERRLQEKRGKAFNLLIPITIDDAIHESDSSMTRFIKRKRIIGDFRQWQDKDQFNKALQQLIQALNADRKDESVQSKLGL